MSRLSKNTKITPMGKAVAELENLIKARGSEFANAEITGAVLSMESLSDAEMLELEHHNESLKSSLESIFAGVGEIPAYAMEAGVLAAMAAGNPLAYAEKAMGTGKISTEGVTLFEPVISGAGGNMDYRSARAASLEAFDEKELKNGIAFSTGFNIGAARQSPAAEALYPTFVVSPDQAFLDISVKKPVVFNEYRHAVSGRGADFGMTNLAEAYIDPTILADASTRCIPVRAADDSNAEYFVAETLYAPVTVKQSGVDVQTAPLKMNKQIDLIGISTVPGLVGNGLMTNNDALDSAISLDAIYLTAPNSDKSKTDFIRFDTSRLPRRNFSKTPEGNYREMGLQFRTEHLLLNKDTVNADGSALQILKAVVNNDWNVRVRVNVDGQANVQFGNVNVYASALEVMSITNSAGQEITLASGPGLAFVQAIALAKFDDYDIKASRTNSNRRTSGLQADVQEFVDRHPIPLGAPLSAPAPVTGPRDGTDLQVLTAMARTRNTNQAFTAWLNYAETLKAYVSAVAAGGMPEIEGAGRYLLRKPFFEEITLDVAAKVDSRTSSDRAEDVAALIVNTIREVAYRMYTETGYQAALDILTGGTAELPTLTCITDPTTIRHIMVNGDNRTAGIAFEHNILSDLDERLKGKIFVTFTRPAALQGPDPLSSGTHAWIPELASVVNVSKGGETIRQSMVQPRNRHINHLPAMAVIDVQNLTAALRDKATIQTHSV